MKRASDHNERRSQFATQLRKSALLLLGIHIVDIAPENVDAVYPDANHAIMHWLCNCR